MKLGVCYYPEHWPEHQWAEDARRMAGLGLSRVRIGEFAWSRIEPDPSRFCWDWLDRAVDVLHAAGLEIILGTPTATPPKWLVDAMPDMLAVDAAGRPRGFGSRRHYCFSHAGYRKEAQRITEAMARRYGNHPAVVAWQTDNEYGCHHTVLSFSASTRDAFREWLARRYGSIEALNAAWGNVFWSMEYRSFAEVELPNRTVTEANPAHWLCFRRFASDEVVSFNRQQARILRELSPGRDIAHNFMGFFTDFDHHAVAADLDVVGWDSYPLGFLNDFDFSDSDKIDYARQGHPDIAAFHHDLYRGCTAAERWWVLEQQPGPVNWATYNPAPLPGMIRLWTLEAMAHGAELVSYFRWRQAPFAQEQYHAGLFRPDDGETPAMKEVAEAAQDIKRLGPLTGPTRQVALIFAYEADWVTQIQPQGAGLSALWAAFECYSACRRLGLNVDIVPPTAPLDGYQLCIIPCLPIVPEKLIENLRRFDGQVIVGPRTGSKTENFAIPPDLPPGALFPGRVVRVESLRPGLRHAGEGWEISRWLEHIETDASPELVADDGTVAAWKHCSTRYLACWPGQDVMKALLERAVAETELPALELPDGLRVRTAGKLLFIFNYSSSAALLPAALQGDMVIGDRSVPPAGVAVVKHEVSRAS